DVVSFKQLSVEYSYNDVKTDDIATPFTMTDMPLLEQYVKEGEINYEKMVQNKELVIVHSEIAKEIFGWDFKLGDSISIKWYNGEKYVEDEFTISAILDSTSKLYRNKEMFKLTFPSGWFLMPDDLLNEMMIPNFNLNSILVVSCNDYQKDYQKVEKTIMSMTENNPLINVSTFEEQVEHSAESFSMLYVMFMGVALFVIAFSLINLLNTLISNTMARKSEFASLSAIGASKKQIRTMILGEGLYFAFINIFMTGTVGSLISYAVIKIANRLGTDYLIYKFPFFQLIGYCLFVLFVTITISFVIANVISKKSLIERLREVE
ncbi:MAG: ABC transporter permease, partial [Turicibacter sp.]